MGVEIGLALLVLGTIVVLLRKPIGARAYSSQARLFAVKSSPATFERAYALAGLVFMVVGLLALLGVVHFGKA